MRLFRTSHDISGFRRTVNFLRTLITPFPDRGLGRESLFPAEGNTEVIPRLRGVAARTPRRRLFRQLRNVMKVLETSRHRPRSANETRIGIGVVEAKSRTRSASSFCSPFRREDHPHSYESGATELPRGVRGRAQQANQSGAIRQLCLSVHGQSAYRSDRLSVIPPSPSIETSHACISFPCRSCTT